MRIPSEGCSHLGSGYLCDGVGSAAGHLLLSSLADSQPQSSIEFPSLQGLQHSLATVSPYHSACIQPPLAGAMVAEKNHVIGFRHANHIPSREQQLYFTVIFKDINITSQFPLILPLVISLWMSTKNDN